MSFYNLCPGKFAGRFLENMDSDIYNNNNSYVFDINLLLLLYEDEEIDVTDKKNVDRIKSVNVIINDSCYENAYKIASDLYEYLFKLYEKRHYIVKGSIIYKR